MRVLSKVFAFICVSICFGVLTMGVNAVALISNDDKLALDKVLSQTQGVYNDTGRALKKTADATKTFSLFTIKEQASSSSKKFWNVTFNVTDFYDYGDSYKDIILKNFQDELEKSSVSSEGRHLIYSEVRNHYDYDFDILRSNLIEQIEPNMFTSYELYKPFSGAMGTILGIICILILLFQIFTTLLDMMYMQFPVFRERVFQMKTTSGGGRFSMVRDRTHLERPWFISYEAAYANKVNVESNGEKNALVIYFSHRVLSLLVIVVCLTYLILGSMSDVVFWLWDKIAQVFNIVY